MNLQENWIQDLAQGDESILHQIYIEYRAKLIGWLVSNRGCELDTAQEIYQISILVLYEQVCSGKLKELKKSSLKTYLFGIAKNKWREHQRHKGRFTDNFLFEMLPEQTEDLERKKLSEKQLQQVEAGMLKLKENCRQILTLFYYNRRSMKDIQQIMNLKSVESTRMMKSRCVKSLREAVVQFSKQII